MTEKLHGSVRYLEKEEPMLLEDFRFFIIISLNDQIVGFANISGSGWSNLSQVGKE